MLLVLERVTNKSEILQPQQQKLSYPEFFVFGKFSKDIAITSLEQIIWAMINM